MKPKDVVILLIAALIFVVTGVVAYGQLKPSGKDSNVVTVEVVDPIPRTFNETAVSYIRDSSKARDFNVPIDLNGLGNPTPFGKR